jgi:hypothetical protein
MQLQLLPNYFKKIGFTLFVLTVWPELLRGFIAGYNAEVESTLTKLPNLPAEFAFLGIEIFSDAFFEVFSILSVVGLIIYALSRDKVIDEFLLKLRMEALHITFFLSAALIFVLLLFDIKSEMSALYVLDIQVIIFLVAKKLKKISAKPSMAEDYE